MNNDALILEEEFNSPVGLVWRAFTEKDMMAKWYFEIAEFKPEKGFKFQFEGGEEGKRYLHLCEVLEVLPLKKIKHSWTYDGYEGTSQVTFELKPLGKKTGLKLIHEGLESFTEPDLAKDKFREGWEYLIRQSLKEFLEKGQALRYW